MGLGVDLGKAQARCGRRGRNLPEHNRIFGGSTRRGERQGLEGRENNPWEGKMEEQGRASKVYKEERREGWMMPGE